VLLADLPGLGVRVVASEGYSADTSDFRSHIQKAIATPKPKAVALLGYPADMAHALKQIRELALRPSIFAPNSFEAEEIITVAGDAAEGVVYVYPVLPDAPNTNDVQRRFMEKYGRPMNVYNGMGYDAVGVLAAALARTFDRSDSLESTDVKDALYDLDMFPGVTGPIRFDKNGDVLDRPMETRVVKNRSFKSVAGP
jgi:branched-chain amino acid transport system substrate-binding protein